MPQIPMYVSIERLLGCALGEMFTVCSSVFQYVLETTPVAIFGPQSGDGQFVGAQAGGPNGALYLSKRAKEASNRLPQGLKGPQRPFQPHPVPPQRPPDTVMGPIWCHLVSDLLFLFGCRLAAFLFLAGAG